MWTLIWFIGSALLVDLVGYWLHRLAHRPGTPLYRAHMVHHIVNYPPKAVVVPGRYISSKGSNLALWFGPILVLYITLGFVLDVPHPWVMAIGGGLVAVLSALIHDLTHVDGSLVWRRAPLIGMAVRHHAHHFKMRRNFGIILPWWDVLFGTRKPSSASLLGRDQSPRG